MVGTFKNSKSDPTKNVNIKLGQVEVAAILDCLDRSRSFSTMHDGDKTIKSIKFETWMSKDEKPVQKGYSFSITISDKQDSTSKTSLYIGLSFAEGRLIREFLISALQTQFTKPNIVVDAF